jgi:peptidoglycan hydrolase CwlO-like protein
MTQLPAAAQLAGENRTQVAQLISNFNELITTSAEWKAAYAKVESNVTALIGAETAGDAAAPAASATAQPATAAPPANAAPETVGTSGTATAGSLDPTLKAKLVEFRTHLKAFEKAAGGVQK